MTNPDLILDALYQELLNGTGHWKIQSYLERLRCTDNNLHQSAISTIDDWCAKTPENKHSQYISAYIKARFEIRNRTFYDAAIALGSVEAIIDKFMKPYKSGPDPWSTRADRLAWINKYPDNGYGYYSIGNYLVEYDYDEKEYPQEAIEEAIEHLKKAIALGHDYAKYRLSYIYIKYRGKIEKGIQLYREAESLYHSLKPQDWDYDLAYYWRHRTNATQDLIDCIDKYQKRADELEKKCEQQAKEIIELRYQPGGPGYCESKEHFEGLASKQ